MGKTNSGRRVKLVNVARIFPHNKRNLKRWLVLYKKHGEKGLEPKSTRPKTNPKKTPIYVKEKVLLLRKETQKCSLKLSWNLKNEWGEYSSSNDSQNHQNRGTHTKISSA